MKKVIYFLSVLIIVFLSVLFERQCYKILFVSSDSQKSDAIFYYPRNIQPRLEVNAAKGINWSSYILGSMYYFGEGRQKDNAKAKELLEPITYLDTTDFFTIEIKQAKKIINSFRKLAAPYTVQEFVASARAEKPFIFTGMTDEQVVDYVLERQPDYARLIVGYEEDKQVPTNKKAIVTIVSPDKTKKATLYNSSILITGVNDNPVKLQLLEIESPRGKLILNQFEVYSHNEFDYIGDFEFFDNVRLKVEFFAATWTGIFILNTDTFEIKYITNGNGELYKLGKVNVIKVYVQKHYFKESGKGAFWVDALYDFDGNLLKFISYAGELESEKCIPIREIIDINNHPKLVQNPDDCIFVIR